MTTYVSPAQYTVMSDDRYVCIRHAGRTIATANPYSRTAPAECMELALRANAFNELRNSVTWLVAVLHEMETRTGIPPVALRAKERGLAALQASQQVRMA